MINIPFAGIKIILQGYAMYMVEKNSLKSHTRLIKGLGIIIDNKYAVSES
jgi:hypothetical protein